MSKSITRSFKHFLTLVGYRLTRRHLIQLQAVINYLAIGRWMREHGFHFPHRVSSRQLVWDAVASQIGDEPVLYLEFGVAHGVSMRYWSKALRHPGSILHGFDSFEGLPESGGPWTKGNFNTGGKIPNIDDDRVRFFKGWFDLVLPAYSLPAHDKLVINMDADLYSSTSFVLRHLATHIKKGTFIYFDEMNHMEHEPRAFDEFLASSGRKFRPVCADKSLAFVFFECIG
jgi:O-methyltransferase